jgi:hypothetical protein
MARLRILGGLRSTLEGERRQMSGRKQNCDCESMKVLALISLSKARLLEV